MKSNLRITISGLLLLTTLVAVVVAAANFLIRAQDQNRAAMMLFFPFVLAAPMATMVLISLCRQATQWLNKRKRNRRP